MQDSDTAGEAPAPPPGDVKKLIGATIAVLGVLAILGAVGALAFSWYVRRQREKRVVGLVRGYCSAQTMFKRNDWDQNGILEYAPDYTVLSTQPDAAGTPIDLIDSAFAAARGENGIPRHGYLFLDMQTIAGVAVDWVNDYALCAAPADYGHPFTRTYIVATNGTVFWKDLGRSEFVTDYPANPTLAGWTIAE